jgi:hypothetical protein
MCPVDGGKMIAPSESYGLLSQIPEILGVLDLQFGSRLGA